MNNITNYKNIKAWPFVEAIKIIKKSENLDSNRAIHFETGYGPSGIPHIGTFAEVLRTNMVRNALKKIKNLNFSRYTRSDSRVGYRSAYCSKMISHSRGKGLA